MINMGAGCQPPIELDVKWWAGYSKEAAIVNEKGETLSCKKKKFDEYLCMHQDKVDELFNDIVEQCK